jgi:succinate-semialdehyde dehydrogenase/glutarate-semialdehyde dehydrogenase
VSAQDNDPRVAYPRLALFIGGEWHDGAGRATRPVIDPSTEQEIGRLPVATEADTDRALDSATKAFDAWRRRTPQQRADVLIRAAALMRERREQIAQTITLELGKPVAESRIEVERMTALFEWHAAEGCRAYGRIVPAREGFESRVMRDPIGVVAAFTPWNGPGASPSRKISAALAAGCAVIIKPAEETPGAAILIAQCLADAGLPAGTLNMLFGNPARISERLIASPAVRAFSFTGSVPVGRALAELGGRHLKPSVLELGGHAPVIVCPDADPVAVARACVGFKYTNAGQICISPTRFFVHRALYGAFERAFIEATGKLKIGNGFEPGVQMGPLANARRRESIEALIEQAVSVGAKLPTGGTRPDRPGYFLTPAVLTDVPKSASALHEEPFGPLALLCPYDDLDDALARANGTPYGLAAYAFTDSAGDAHRISRELQCGTVSINHFAGAGFDTPFGGVKDSGWGREGGAECFEGYLTTKLVSQRCR